MLELLPWQSMVTAKVVNTRHQVATGVALSSADLMAVLGADQRTNGIRGGSEGCSAGPACGPYQSWQQHRARECESHPAATPNREARGGL